MHTGHMTTPTPRHISGILRWQDKNEPYWQMPWHHHVEMTMTVPRMSIWLDCCVSNATILNQQSNNYFVA